MEKDNWKNRSALGALKDISLNGIANLYSIHEDKKRSANCNIQTVEVHSHDQSHKLLNVVASAQNKHINCWKDSAESKSEWAFIDVKILTKAPT